jgi:ankyrin repeat protein
MAISQSRLNFKLAEASLSANLKLIKIHVANGADIHYDNDRIFIMACSGGHLDIVQYLITISENDNKYNQDILDEGFHYSCKYWQLEIVKYLATIYQTTKYNRINIHSHYERLFIDMCCSGKLNIVKYLTTLYKTHNYNIIDIHISDELAFILACNNGFIDIVKYLTILYRKHKIYDPINIYSYDMMYTNGNCLTRTIDLYIIKYIENLGFYRLDSYNNTAKY